MSIRGRVRALEQHVRLTQQAGNGGPSPQQVLADKLNDMALRFAEQRRRGEPRYPREKDSPIRLLAELFSFQEGETVPPDLIEELQRRADQIPVFRDFLQGLEEAMRKAKR